MSARPLTALAAFLVVATVVLSQLPVAAQQKSKARNGKVKADQSTKNQGAEIVGKILEVDYVELEINPPTLEVTATGEVPRLGYSPVSIT